MGLEHLGWIRPIGKAKKPILCEFCKSDVSTPYKGVHFETEEINGMPHQCRNNGKLNCDIAWPSLVSMRKDNQKEGYVWFIEQDETQMWWTGYRWTKDPHEAFSFNIEFAARRFAELNRMKNCKPTEHEFIN